VTSSQDRGRCASAILRSQFYDIPACPSTTLRAGRFPMTQITPFERPSSAGNYRDHREIAIVVSRHHRPGQGVRGQGVMNRGPSALVPAQAPRALASSLWKISRCSTRAQMVVYAASASLLFGGGDLPRWPGYAQSRAASRATSRYCIGATSSAPPRTASTDDGAWPAGQDRFRARRSRASRARRVRSPRPT